MLNIDSTAAHLGDLVPHKKNNAEINAEIFEMLGIEGLRKVLGAKIAYTKAKAGCSAPISVVDGALDKAMKKQYPGKGELFIDPNDTIYDPDSIRVEIVKKKIPNKRSQSSIDPTDSTAILTGKNANGHEDSLILAGDENLVVEYDKLAAELEEVEQMLHLFSISIGD